LRGEAAPGFRHGASCFETLTSPCGQAPQHEAD
jgi:hypothetical protein